MDQNEHKHVDIAPDVGYYGTLSINRKDLMKYFILEKFKYIRGEHHDMPANDMCRNGFDDLESAEKALAALKVLNHRPDMVSYIIVQETDAKKN